MIITDDTDETFREDMRYMRMLMDRIFRTAYSSGLKIVLNDSHPSPYEAIGDELDEIEAEINRVTAGAELEEGTIKELGAAPAVTRDEHGQFTKT